MGLFFEEDPILKSGYRGKNPRQVAEVRAFSEPIDTHATDEFKALDLETFHSTKELRDLKFTTLELEAFNKLARPVAVTAVKKLLDTLDQALAKLNELAKHDDRNQELHIEIFVAYNWRSILSQGLDAMLSVPDERPTLEELELMARQELKLRDMERDLPKRPNERDFLMELLCRTTGGVEVLAAARDKVGKFKEIRTVLAEHSHSKKA